MKENQWCLKDLWNNITYFNIHEMSVSEGDEREKGEENEEMAKNYYSYLMKNLNSQTHVQMYNG